MHACELVHCSLKSKTVAQGRFVYVELAHSFWQGGEQETFFESQEANSRYLYFRTVNVLWQLYPGEDKQSFFSKARWEQKENSRVMLIVICFVWTGQEWHSFSSSLPVNGSSMALVYLHVSPCTEPCNSLSTATVSNETVTGHGMVKMTTMAGAT